MPQTPIPHVAPHPQANMEKPTMRDMFGAPISGTPRPGDLPALKGAAFRGDLEIGNAHERLFGPGQKMSGAETYDAGAAHRAGKSVDEMAMDMRPRAADYGKDINLPAAKGKK